MTIDVLLESVDDIEYKTLDEIIQEAKLKAKERNELQDELFGLPEQRKFPLNDYNHILAAIRFFNRADQKDQKELAKNIFKAMKKHKVPMSKIGKNNKLRNYLPTSVNEATIPVVGIKNKPMIVNHMMNNAFTSLSVDQDIISNCLYATTNALMNKEDKYYLSYIPYISESSHMDPTIGFYVDRNGIFVMNENSGLRSPSYKNVDDIDDRTILYITYRELNDQRINSL